MFFSKDTSESREKVSAESMILTRRESNMSIVEVAKTSLDNTTTPHPDIFMSNLNGGGY